MRKKALLAMLAWLATGQAWAANVAGCSVNVTSIPFGQYDPTSPNDLTPSGSISVSCQLISGLSLLVAYNITLSTGSSGSYLQRKMTGTTTPLLYNLYLTGSQVWGDGLTGGSVSKVDGYLLGLGNVVLTYTVFSRLPAQQLVAAGSYNDNIVVTVSY